MASFSISVSISVLNVNSSFYYQKPEFNLNYTLLTAVDITLDPNSLNRYIRSGNVFTISDDNAALHFGKVASDATYLSEQTVLNVGKYAQDNVYVTESLSITATFFREFSDGLSMSEALSTDLDTVKTDDLSVLENISVHFSRPVSDSLSVSDSPALSFSMVTIDALPISESLSRVVTYNRSFNDSFILDDFTDIDAIVKDTVVDKTNVFSISEINVISFSKGLADNYSLVELSAIDVGKPLSDSFGMSESLLTNLVSGNSSVLNVQAINTFALNQ